MPTISTGSHSLTSTYTQQTKKERQPSLVGVPRSSASAPSHKPLAQTSSKFPSFKRIPTLCTTTIASVALLGYKWQYMWGFPILCSKFLLPGSPDLSPAPFDTYLADFPQLEATENAQPTSPKPPNSQKRKRSPSVEMKEKKKKEEFALQLWRRRLPCVPGLSRESDAAWETLNSNVWKKVWHHA